MKNLYLALLLVCSSIYYSNAQIGYAGIIESGVFNVLNDTFPITKLHFSTGISNGFALGKNGYLGVGLSYNRYEFHSIVPITLDFKYCLFGDGFSIDPEQLSLFFGISGGSALKSPNRSGDYDKGLFLKSNVGIMVHVNSDARFIINLGHMMQEPKLTSIKQFQSIYVNIGLAIRPARAKKKDKTKKKKTKKSPLDILNG
jgi:hypothetical protein